MRRSRLDFLYIFCLATLLLHPRDDWIVDEDVDGTTSEPRWCRDRLAAGYCQGQIRSRRINGCVDIRLYCERYSFRSPGRGELRLRYRQTDHLAYTAGMLRMLQDQQARTIAMGSIGTATEKTYRRFFLCFVTPTRCDIGAVEPIPTRYISVVRGLPCHDCMAGSIHLLTGLSQTRYRCYSCVLLHGR